MTYGSSFYDIIIVFGSLQDSKRLVESRNHQNVKNALENMKFNFQYNTHSLSNEIWWKGVLPIVAVQQSEFIGKKHVVYFTEWSDLQ